IILSPIPSSYNFDCSRWTFSSTPRGGTVPCTMLFKVGSNDIFITTIRLFSFETSKSKSIVHPSLHHCYFSRPLRASRITTLRSLTVPRATLKL
ncbi:hypothetical protein PFISCL1PPCAC_24689, partial [Pristionchus fissidentatus]